MKITVKNIHDKKKEENQASTSEERLDLVEQLRIQSGKFLYDYPARLRRTIRVFRKEDLIRNKKASGRTQDKADVEHLE